MNEKDLAELLAQYGISEEELPAALQWEQTRKRNVQMNATFRAIKVAAYGGQQVPTLEDLIEPIDDAGLLRELVAMFAMALAGRRDALHDVPYENGGEPVIASLEEVL